MSNFNGTGVLNQPVDFDATLKNNDRLKVEVLSVGGPVIQVSSNDQSTGYLEAKVVAEAGATTVTTLNDGGDEDLQIGLAAVGTPGTYGSATQVPVLTTDAKGRVTAVTNTSITVTPAAISGFDEAAQDAVGAALTDTASVDLTYNDGANTISAAVLPAGVDHNALQNYVANRHIDHSAVNITAGTGLSGGGDITTSRTLNIANTGVTAASYGSASQVGTFTVNAQGQLSAAANATISITSAAVTDFTEAAQDSVGGALTDTASVDLTYNDGANTISATVLPAGVDHNSLANLTTGDVHTQYALLAGRSGGQNLRGGTAASNNLILESTSDATKGSVILQPTNGQVFVGTSSGSLSSKLQIDSTTQGFLMPRVTTSQMEAISSPAVGLQVYNTDLQTVCFFDGAQWLFEITKVVQNNQSSTSTTYATITELETPSLPVGRYVFWFIGVFQTTAGFNGAGFRLSGGTAAYSSVIADWQISDNSNGNDKNYEYNQLSDTTNVASGGVDASNSDRPVWGKGVFSLSTAGTVSVQLRSENNGTGVSVRINSALIIKRLTG